MSDSVCLLGTLCGKYGRRRERISMKREKRRETERETKRNKD
jgi:hypothetical protein